MPQAMTGSRKSIPKVVRVNAADGEAVLYRNLGDGRRLPFVWGTTVTLASGATTAVVSSGVSFNGNNVSAGIAVTTPLSSAGAALTTYLAKDTTANTVTLTATGAPSEDCNFDVIIMLGTAYDFLSTHSNQVFNN